MSKAHQKGLASSIFASQIPPYLVQITACQRGASSPLNPPQNPRSTIQKYFSIPLFFYFRAIYIKIYTSLFIFCCNFAFCFK